jgi:hypothetical protein
MLGRGKWNFAARTQEIDKSTSVVPDFGFANAFSKPTDYVNMIKISHSETFFPPFGPNEYTDEGDYFYADCDPLYLSFVSDDTSYGGDLSLWPEVFATAFEHELAWRIAPLISSMSGAEKEELRLQKVRTLKEARSWDASKHPPDPMPRGRLARSRLGGRGTYWREHR